MKEKVVHALKGIGIFLTIYLLGAVLAEIVLLVGLSVLGYDGLHGEMPDSYWTGLFPLYGFALFAVLSVLFHIAIRKKKLEDLRMRFDRQMPAKLFGGLLAGAVLVGVAVLCLTLAGAYQWNGRSSIYWDVLLASFGGYLVQGFSEELMCRGMLQSYFEEKASRTAAVLLTAVVFILPHAASILDHEPMVLLFSFVNLLLVSVLFSLSMFCFKSLWVPAGIHIGWNFTLSCICGLELSGGESTGGALRFLPDPSMGWLHGGTYGIEAGFAVTVLLLVCDVALYQFMKAKKE